MKWDLSKNLLFDSSGDAQAFVTFDRRFERCSGCGEAKAIFVDAARFRRVGDASYT